ncbi:MAG: cytochrome c oxidase assembly factor Coa1 family protein [Janthinobacterium lividum]
MVEPTAEQVNEAVDEVLAASLHDAHRSGGVCPLCGHSQKLPFWNRKTVLFSLMIICVLLALAILTVLHRISQTERSEATSAALLQVQRSDIVKLLLGTPIVMQTGVDGRVTHDETGWQEVQLTLPIRGPKGEAMVEVTGGRSHDAWIFSPFEVVIAAQHKKVDLVSGKVKIFDPAAYVDVHTQAAQRPEYLRTEVPAPVMDGTYPCVTAPVIGETIVASLSRCRTPVGQAQNSERFTVDLRYGAFVLQQPDLMVKDGTNVVLTRSYRSDDWLGANRSHAFGKNSNHPYDVAIIGSRNPYTYLDLVLEDGEFLHFDRISKGTGYANAVYQHSETSTRFYKATISWNGGGWTLILADGSRMEFPESYQALNLAQGAAMQMMDDVGRKLALRRDRQRNLLAIDTPDHSTMKFSYDDQARIVRAEDDNENWTRYAYSSHGLLSDVVTSSGTSRHYDYEGSLMTTITEEHGHVILRNTYSQGQVVRQEYAGGQIFQYTYQLSPKRNYVEKAFVRFPDGSSHEVVIDGLPEVVRANLPA